ncbi:MAG: hypothetical protein RLZZ515_2101, partial [Cyanobacteriota bacterium]
CIEEFLNSDGVERIRSHSVHRVGGEDNEVTTTDRVAREPQSCQGLGRLEAIVNCDHPEQFTE